MGYQPTDIETEISKALQQDYRLPHRRLEAWKWTDVSRAVTSDLPGMMVRHEDLSFDLSGQSKPLALLFEPGHQSVSVTVPAGAQAVMMETYTSGAAAFYDTKINIDLGEGAQLLRIQTQGDHAGTVRLCETRINMADRAGLQQYAIVEGGKLVRLETRAKAAKNCTAIMNGAYLLNDKRHVDLTSHFDITGTDVNIRQNVKGIVTDASRGVFQGKFHVERAGQHTDAVMRHDALMLSENAEVRAKPELEIYADDVACEHGNTIGALDDAALFYMRQRGIPASEARALLIEAFLSEVFDTMDDEAARDTMTARVRAWLEQER